MSELQDRASESLAASLSQWQILDMVHLYRTSRPITYCPAPTYPCQRLLAAKILAHGGPGYLHAGPMFTVTFEALKRLGRIAEYQPLELS